MSPRARLTMARCWGLWRRWAAWERQCREAGRPLPDRALLWRLWRHIRAEVRDGDV